MKMGLAEYEGFITRMLAKRRTHREERWTPQSASGANSMLSNYELQSASFYSSEVGMTPWLRLACCPSWYLRFSNRSDDLRRLDGPCGWIVQLESEQRKDRRLLTLAYCFSHSNEDLKSRGSQFASKLKRPDKQAII